MILSNLMLGNHPLAREALNQLNMGLFLLQLTDLYGRHRLRDLMQCMPDLMKTLGGVNPTCHQSIRDLRRVFGTVRAVVMPGTCDVYLYSGPCYWISKLACIGPCVSFYEWINYHDLVQVFSIGAVGMKEVVAHPCDPEIEDFLLIMEIVRGHC